MPPGETFGRFRLRERLARGGMAEIWLAEMVGAAGVTRPAVVKKILPAHAENPRFVTMFVEEARIAMTLAHGNIAQVFDFGEEGGEYYIAMEYVRGAAWDEVLSRAGKRRVAVPAPVAMFVAREVLSGLHYAHTRAAADGRPLGIVHRDVSPQNLVVSFEGQVKIVDFGIAKASDSQMLTEPGKFKGKIRYLSPEQVKSRPADARTDVYATAVVLYETLAGHSPFESDDPSESFAAIATGDCPPLAEVADVPDALSDVVARGMAVDPAERYPSAREMAEALERILHAAAPRFGEARVAQFVQWIADDVYRHEVGEPPRLPTDFLEQIPLWEQAWRDRQGSRPAPTPAPRSRPASARALPARRRIPRPALFALVGLILLVGVLAGVLLGRGRGPSLAELRVTSTPGGAAIWVDGTLTPLVTGERSGDGTRLTGLAPGEHRFTFRLGGYEDREEVLRFAPDRPESLVGQRLDVVLERTERPRPVPVALPDAGVVHPSGTPASDAAPSFLEGILDPRRHVVVPAEPIAVVRKLDPRHTYALKVLDSDACFNGLMGPVLRFWHAWYHARGPKGAKLGLAERNRPTVLTGVSKLSLFLLDLESSDNAGSMKLSLEDRTAHTRETIRLDAVKNCVMVNASNSLEVRGSAVQRWRIDVSGAIDLGPGGAPLVGFYLEISSMLLNASGPDDCFGVLHVPDDVAPRPMFPFARFFVVDDDPSDNSGSLRIRYGPP